MFQEKRSPVFKPVSPSFFRRLSAPVGSDRKSGDVSYGGFAEHLLKVNKDVEIEEDSDQSDGSINDSSSFSRRARSPAVRRKKIPQRSSGSRMSLPPGSLSLSSLTTQK